MSLFAKIKCLSDEEQKEFEETATIALQDLAPLFSFWLHNTEEAKNFMRMRFGKPTDENAFDLILRKIGSDDDVICHHCGRIKISEEQVLFKSE
jgi:hypothetical protein